MRSESPEVQWSLFESDEIPWQSLPEDVRVAVVEFLSHLFKEEANSVNNTIEEEAKNA